MQITDQQMKFCKEYMKDFNGTQAAIRAGYAVKAARTQASQLLTNLNIQKYLEILKEQNGKREEKLTEDIKNELIKLGFSNIQDFIEADNEIKDLTTIPANHAACVESIKKTVTEFGDGKNAGTKTSIQFKLHSKLDALEKLARYVGLYEADNKQRGAVITVEIDD